MELNTTECGTRQVFISREECDDFEIAIGEEGGLLLQPDSNQIDLAREHPCVNDNSRETPVPVTVIFEHLC